MNYLTYDEIVELHDWISLHSECLDGVHDESLLISCLDWVRDDDFYEGFDGKLTHLVFSIAMNHGFADGNKRTAIVAGAYFMYVNGVSLDCVCGFPRYMENVVLRLAKGEISKTELREMISGYLRSFDERSDD